MSGENIILGEIVITETKGFKRVVRYLQGIHPGKGTIMFGLTGWETKQEVVVFKIKKFTVIDLETTNVQKTQEI